LLFYLVKSIKYLNVRPGILKLLKENIEEKFHDIHHGSDFMNVRPDAQATK
jgi:hypothetical protein